MRAVFYILMAINNRIILMPRCSPSGGAATKFWRVRGAGGIQVPKTNFSQILISPWCLSTVFPKCWKRKIWTGVEKYKKHTRRKSRVSKRKRKKRTKLMDTCLPEIQSSGTTTGPGTKFSPKFSAPFERQTRINRRLIYGWDIPTLRQDCTWFALNLKNTDELTWCCLLWLWEPYLIDVGITSNKCQVLISDSLCSSIETCQIFRTFQLTFMGRTSVV